MRKTSVRTLRRPKKLTELSVPERILYAQRLWDSIADESSIPLTNTQKAELDRCLLEYHESPGAGETWEEVKASILEEK